MSEGRALLTDREREAVAGERSDSYRYKTRSYLRGRVEKLRDDVEVLAEHDPEPLEELRAVVCEAEETGAEGEQRTQTPPLDREETASTAGEPTAGRDADEQVAENQPSGGVHENIDVGEEIEALVENLDLPGTGSKLEKRRNAIGDIIAAMRDAGEVENEQIRTIAERNDNGGYGSGWEGFRGNVWSGHAVPQLKERGVLANSDASGTYVFGSL